MINFLKQYIIWLFTTTTKPLGSSVIGVTVNNNTPVNVCNYHPGRRRFQNTYDLDIIGNIDNVYARIRERLIDSLVLLSRLHNS